MRYIILSCISSLLFSGIVYAADCVTEFDNSCFPQSSERYPDDGYEYRQQQLEEARRHAAGPEQTCEMVLQDMALQQSAYEQSIIAEQLTGGFTLRPDELEGLSAEERREARERYATERPAALIARSRETLALRQAEVLRSDCNRRR